MLMADEQHQQELLPLGGLLQTTDKADLYEDEGQLKGGRALLSFLVASSKHLHR